MTETATTSSLSKPAHIPESLVYEFDLFGDPALLTDPHARILDIVKHAPPIFWSPRPTGHWVLAGHEAVFEGMRDWELFTSESTPQSQIQAMLAQRPAGAPHFPQPLPINADPPLHGKYRVPLNATFSPKAMNALKDGIRALARDLISKIAPQGRSEFMADVAEPLPVQVFLKMLGLPVERQAEYRELVQDQLAALQSAEESRRMLMKIAATMRPTFAERREQPQDDIITLLWNTEIDGKPVTMDDMEDFGVLLFIAGLDTVMNGIGHGVRHLAMDTALQDKLRADPALIPKAAEELLRRYTFTVPTRRVAKDIMFQGVEMKAGELVDILLPAADLDPRHFNRPDHYDMQREDNVHIAFGTGPHRCLGSHLARIELQVLYEELLAGLPQFQLDPANPPKFHGGRVIGPDHLHLIWNV
jgi:cytochrome P450